MSGARAPASRNACANKPPCSHRRCCLPSRYRGRVAASAGQSLPRRSPTVFSLLGVLGITLVLFVVVVMTAGLILGK